MQGLFHDLAILLHEYLLALYTAHCYRGYIAAYTLANQALPGLWKHPMQITMGMDFEEQQPQAWHIPESYEATAVLEANWRQISNEIVEMEPGGMGGAYMENSQDASLVGKGEWVELRLYDQATDTWNQTNCAQLHRTCKILQGIPSLSFRVSADEVKLHRIPGVVSVFRLQPRSSLVPHTGPTNLRTTLHLGLQVPESKAASITVGGETRQWTAGKVLAFDDSFVHSVENHHPSQSRTVLLVNVWKPGVCKRYGCA
jgi:aspartyl/asparaginyl beta-hydroxylase (cupin superfamily)